MLATMKEGRAVSTNEYPSVPSPAAALSDIAARNPAARVLICGSLYLAGSVLRENG